MSLNGKQLCSRNHMTKNGAKRTCSESIMKSIQNKNDYIYVHKDYMGRTITKQELIAEGQKLRAMGHPPSIYIPWEPKEGGEKKSEFIILQGFFRHSPLKNYVGTLMSTRDVKLFSLGAVVSTCPVHIYNSNIYFRLCI